METCKSSIPGPRCCCGSVDCAFLAHNARLLEGLEHNVSKAAQLGQVRSFCLTIAIACHCTLPSLSPRMHDQQPLLLLQHSPHHAHSLIITINLTLTHAKSHARAAEPPLPP
jgi:hypothetical protein